MEMFYNMIKPTEGETEGGSDSDEDHSKGFKMIEEHKKEKKQHVYKLSKKGQKIRNKIKFVSKMLIMQKTLR